MAPGTPTKADRSRRRAEVAESIKLLASLNIAECGSAIDDSDDVDSDYAKRQKSLTRRRRIEKRGGGKLLSVQDVLPFKVVPNVLPLSPRDLESVMAIQNVAFTNQEHRTPREVLKHRLRTCPGLCFGLFCTINPSEAAAKGWDIESLHTAHDVETGRQNGAKHVLLAYIVGTRALGDRICDDNMACPEDWEALNGKPGQVGNQKAGRTIVVHSAAVVPKLQRHGLGKLIIKAYIQHMNSAGMGDRIVLRCQPHEISFFNKFGFIHNGPRSASASGTGFQDMFIKLPGQQTKAVAQKQRA